MVSFIDKAMRRAGAGGLDLPVALLLGAAAALLVMLTPVGMLEELVLRSGLPGIFPAAEPPLGLRARIGFAGLAGMIGFGAAYALMRAIDRASGLFEDEETADDRAVAGTPPPPRVRRRDQHPDAPVRQPLSAARELGDPTGGVPAATTPEPEPEPQPEPDPAPAPVAERKSAGWTPPWRRDRIEVDSADGGDRLQRIRGARPIVAHAEPPRSVVMTKPATPDMPWPEPEPAMPPVDTWPVEREPNDVPLDEPAVPTLTAELVEPPLPPEPVAPTLAPAPLPPSGHESVADLLVRLERALARGPRAVPTDQAPPPLAAEPPLPPEPERAPVDAEGMDARLRSALDNLKRFAPGRG